MLLVVSAAIVSRAQESDSARHKLSGIEVRAFGQTRKLREVPAAVGFIDRQTLERFNSTSIVQAVNTLAGVRMEERSPGSYRFNIRGSSLRSPFGVRNVKVYFNDIPLTDPGGTTYLNGLGSQNFASIEVVKGPGSSLYGAGTGGVLLMESLLPGAAPLVTVDYSMGSYGLQNAGAAVNTVKAESQNRVGFQHQVANGYRRHSALKRDVFSWNGLFRFGEVQLLKTTFLYSNLFYETPGALTKTEFDKDPRSARPAGGGFPGAETSNAAINQKTFLAGASFTQPITASLSNQSTLYGMFTEMRNPAIRNFGKANEPHAGGRTSITFRKNLQTGLLTIQAGGELQQSFSTSTVFKNRGGQADSLQTEDEIHIRQSSLFFQGDLLVSGWELTAGTSINGSRLRFRRAFPAPLPEQDRRFSHELTPRFAVARKFSAFTLYSSVSKGFSPPTSAELLPSGSATNLSLEAELGTNFDLGIRSSLVKNLSIDVNAFYFYLKNTIVQRRDAAGGDYFINAGRTAQAGIETALNYSLLQPASPVRQLNAWLNHSYHHFRYKEFKQLAVDFSGKALPGVPPHTLSSGVEVRTGKGVGATVTYSYSSSLPLNDANSESAASYHLLGARLAYEKRLRDQHRVRLVFGADNLLNQRYSLGNDINAFGGRYYNAAARRNYYLSILWELLTQR